MTEEWKRLDGKNNTYYVSNTGVFRKNDVSGAQINQFDNSNGYLRVPLVLPNSSQKLYLSHRVVAELFVPNPNNKPFVNHIDGDKHNNCADNLEWCTRSENEKHAWRIGLKNKNTVGTKGERHGMHKLSQEQVDYIRKSHVPFDEKFGSKGLAKEFGVTPQTITNIVHYANWKNDNTGAQ